MNRVLWLDHKDPVLMACHTSIDAVFAALFRVSPTLLPHPPSPFFVRANRGCLHVVACIYQACEIFNGTLNVTVKES